MVEVPGCVGFELWPRADGREYEVVTRWESRTDFEHWRRSESFWRAHGDTRGMEQVGSRLVVCDVVLGAWGCASGAGC